MIRLPEKVRQSDIEKVLSHATTTIEKAHAVVDEFELDQLEQ